MDRSFSVSDLKNFEKLVAPKILKIIYWLGLVGIALLALVALFGGLRTMEFSFAAGLGGVLLSIIGFAFGVLMWRVLIEIYTVFFGIYERLGDIRKSLDKP